MIPIFLARFFAAGKTRKGWARCPKRCCTGFAVQQKTVAVTGVLDGTGIPQRPGNALCHPPVIDRPFFRKKAVHFQHAAGSDDQAVIVPGTQGTPGLKELPPFLNAVFHAHREAAIRA